MDNEQNRGSNFNIIKAVTVVTISAIVLGIGIPRLLFYLAKDKFQSKLDSWSEIL